MALLALLPILGFAGFLHLRFHRSFAVSIFVAISFIISMLFAFGLVGFLKIGGHLLFYIGSGLFLFSLYLNRQKMAAALCSVPGLLFILASIGYVYLFQDARYAFWDEFSHWGIFIKEMMYTHHFYDAASSSIHLRYPPGAATWEYFIALNTGYSEASTYFAIFLLLSGSTLMMFDKLTWKQPHWIILIVLIQAVFFASFGLGFTTIMVDHVISAFLVGLVLCFVTQKFDNKSLGLLLFPLLALALIKSVGLYFSLSVAALFFLFAVWEKNFFKIGLLLGMMVAIVLAHQFWNMRQDHLGVAAEEQSVNGVLASIVSDTSPLTAEEKQLLKQRFVDVFLHQQVHQSAVSLAHNEFTYELMSRYQEPKKFTTLTILLFYLIMILIYFLLSQSDERRRDVMVVSSWLLAVVLFYFVILYFSYYVSFDKHGLRIPSYMRYINTGILPLLLIGFTLYLPCSPTSSATQQKKFYLALGLLLLSTWIINPYWSFLYEPLRDIYRPHVDQLISSVQTTIPADSQVLVVVPVMTHPFIRRQIKYSLIPIRSVIRNDLLSKSQDELAKLYSQFDYLWFPFNDKMTEEKLMPQLDPATLKIPTVFKIDVSASPPALRPVL